MKIKKAPPSTIQTFTYYIPAPPKRKTGYRENEFDEAFFNFINQGYKLISMHTTANQDGMWITALVKSTSKKTATPFKKSPSSPLLNQIVPLMNEESDFEV